MLLNIEPICAMFQMRRNGILPTNHHLIKRSKLIYSSHNNKNHGTGSPIILKIPPEATPALTYLQRQCQLRTSQVRNLMSMYLQYVHAHFLQ